MPEDWTDIEVDLIIADYFSMLKDEIAGKPYNKSDHRRGILPLLLNRSEGSIEFKYQNISAVLSKFGVPWINGYKPRWNYQQILERKIGEYIKKNLSLEHDFLEFAEGDLKKLDQPIVKFESFVETPPDNSSVVMEEALVYESPVKRNYLELEQNNKRLGNFGEELVINYEKWRLSEAGKDSLADKVEWVAQTRGDWIGYDILSKNNNGSDRYIEVKTTKLGKDAPIFFSKNEFEFSKKNSQSYFLYRVFNFNSKPKLFVVNGKYEDYCRIEAINFKGYF